MQQFDCAGSRVAQLAIETTHHVRVSAMAIFRRRAMIPARILLVETNEDGTVGGSYRCMADIAANLDRRTFYPVALFYEANWIADELAQRR